MKISVIIPTLNEEATIGNLVRFIQINGGLTVAEIIVVDALSTDSTVSQAQKNGALVFQSAKKSRATQLNFGASKATGDILYFVHADVKLRPEFSNDILEAIKSGYKAGCYRYQFDSPRTILKINAYFTRFNRIMCRGGDQTLFVQNDAFKQLGGYNEEFVIMEDYELLQRIQRAYSFKIIPKSITVSARKYDTNSWLRVQIANLTVFLMYFRKRPPADMASKYKKMLDYR